MTTTTKILTLTNSFHGSHYTTRKTREELDAIERRVCCGTATDAEKAFVRRVRKTLCGMSDCTCATSSYGERR